MKTYRAWIDEQGWRMRRAKRDSLYMIDLETNNYTILVRFLMRRKPFYFAVLPFWRGRRGYIVLRLGRKLGRRVWLAPLWVRILLYVGRRSGQKAEEIILDLLNRLRYDL